MNTDTNSNLLITTGIICKLDTSGNLIWKYLYQGPYANSPEGLYATPDSGVLVSIDAGPYPNLNHAHLIKLDKNGNLQWDRLLPFSMGNNYVKLIDYVPATQECVFLASTYSDSMLIVKTDSNKQRVWNVSYLAYTNVGTPICNLSQVIKDRWGYIGIGGYARHVTGYSASLWVLKIDGNGNKIWEAFYDSTITKSTALVSFGGSNLGVMGIDTMPGGGYIVGGTIQDSLYDQTGFVMRLDSNGCLSDPCEASLFTSIEIIHDNMDVRVFPNPTSSLLFIETVPQSSSMSIHVTDLLGRDIYTQPLNESTTAIDCHSWSKGIFIWSIWSQGVVIKSGKVVIE